MLYYAANDHQTVSVVPCLVCELFESKRILVVCSDCRLSTAEESLEHQNSICVLCNNFAHNAFSGTAAQ